VIASWYRVAALVLIAATASDAQSTQAKQLFQQGLAYQKGAGNVKADPEQALRFYLQALRLEPAFYEAHANAGRVYYVRKDYRRAKYHLSEAIKLARVRDDVTKQEEAQLTSDIGGCYYQEGDLTKAEQFFRGALGLDPRLVEAHYNLINLLLSQDHRAAARQQMAVAERLAPSSRYGVFQGRLQTQESYASWNPLWLKVALGGVAGGGGPLRPRAFAARQQATPAGLESRCLTSSPARGYNSRRTFRFHGAESMMAEPAALGE
jgi:tetratricopeptide (TPR) repeat protein